VSCSPLTRSTLRRTVAAAVGTAALLGAVACGSGSAPPAEPAPTSAPPAAAGHGGHGGHGAEGVAAPTLYAVQTGPLGVVLTDGSGRLVYRSAADSAEPPTSNCTGACAETWIPLLAEPDRELDLAGVSDELVGRIERADGGTQLTLAGWPLYRHRDDDGSLTTSGHHGEDGTWFVVTPTGEQAAPNP
jgi:predicted lipoprotein with Yx(FWY)xxD motif